MFLLGGGVEMETIRERDPVMLAAREAFVEFRASLEASGPPPNWDKIAELGSARDFEEAQRQKLATLTEIPTVLDGLFPRKILDYRLQKGLAQGDYRAAVIKLLVEFCLCGESEVEPRVTGKSKIWSIFGLNYDDFHGPKKLPEAIAARKFFDAILSFFIHYDESRAGEVLHWLMHSHLPAAVSGLARDNRVDPLSKPIGDGLTLGDGLVDKRAEEKFDEIDDALVLETALEELPASQREDSKLFIEADDEGMTPEQLCAERKRDFKAAQRNFERALKTLRSKRVSP